MQGANCISIDCAQEEGPVRVLFYRMYPFSSRSFLATLITVTFIQSAETFTNDFAFGAFGSSFRAVAPRLLGLTKATQRVWFKHFFFVLIAGEFSLPFPPAPASICRFDSTEHTAVSLQDCD